MRLEVLTVRTKKGACAVCGVWAELQVDVCGVCLGAPAEARLLLEARQEAAGRRGRAAWLHLNRCVDLLSPEDAETWGRAREALEQYHSGTADAETRRRVQQMQALVDKGKAPAGLSVTWTAYEHHYWAQKAAEEGQRRVEVALAALARATGEEETHP